jgi:hypothetical protein
MLRYLQTSAPSDFARLVDSVARQIVTTQHRPDGSFINTPLVYPNGSTVVVKIHQSGERYFVTDMGLGYQEADLMGASNIYSRHARLIAEAAGIKFDHQAFFVIEATREQLSGAVVTVANCSQEAVIVTAYRLSERRDADEAERLYERLIRVFSTNRVSKDAEVIGHSSTKWPVTTLVRPEKRGRVTVFEPVRKHHGSIAHVNMKFSDLRALEKPPNCVAVVQRKAEFGTWLGVLTLSANVIDDDVPNETFVRLAEAA